MSLVDLDHKEIALLKAALLSYKDCPTCAKEYPRTHGTVVRYVLPKIRRIANQRFEALTSLDEQIKFLDSEEAV
jgi:hypothetical protein